jgi:tetratricopeptide (TPR) repeat protein
MFHRPYRPLHLFHLYRPVPPGWVVRRGGFGESNLGPVALLCITRKGSAPWTANPLITQGDNSMQRSFVRALAGLSLLAMSLPATASPQGEPAQELDKAAMKQAAAHAKTPLYDNLGTLHLAVTTRSPVAQKFFDQGLRLTYGFNHDEAINSFTEGARLDSACAMCYWGIAYALGPNINLPMDTGAVKPAYESIERALKLSAKVTPHERAFIQALAKRYSINPPADRAPLDSAYAKAMGEVVKRYPSDPNAATLYAEALMDLRPWRYWNNSGKPLAPSTLEQLTLLERTVKRYPDHIGACHLYIHAIEASYDAAKALPCANRLAQLAPGAGHLVHMPSHIYLRLGMWEEAVGHNVHAVHADEKFIQDRHPNGVYPIGYYPHNYHMMWSALQQLGRGEETIRAGRKVVEIVNPDVIRQVPFLEGYAPVAILSLVRFSRWADVLKEPAPPRDFHYANAMWHYARGLAYAETSHPDSAKAEATKLTALTDSVPEQAVVGQNSARAILAIAGKHLAGIMAAKAGNTEEAVKLLREGVALEDELIYDEPPDWQLPLRQPLGAVLLTAERPADAEKAYREDLKRFPRNGWSLYGLTQSLKAQGKTAEATTVEEQFRKTWQKADMKLAAVQ